MNPRNWECIRSHSPSSWVSAGCGCFSLTKALWLSNRTDWGLISLHCPVLPQLFCEFLKHGWECDCPYFKGLSLSCTQQDPQSHKGPLLPTSWATPDSVLGSEQQSAFHFYVNHMLLLRRKVFISQVTQITPIFQGAADTWVTHEPRKKDQKMRQVAIEADISKFYCINLQKGFATIANQV